MTVRAIILPIHRWLSLGAALFWLIQALTGALIVFHWEIADALIPGRHVPTDLKAIGQSIARLTPPGSGKSPSSLWTSAGSADRYDLTISGPLGDESLRIDGAGRILAPDGDPARGMIDDVVLLHHNLLAGDTGSWIVGISGGLLLSTLIMGIILSWPRRRAWRRALTPPPGGLRGAAKYYGWHRAIGLWAAFPAAIIAALGVMLVFADGMERIVNPPPVEAKRIPPQDAPQLPFDRLVTIALDRYPGATLTAVRFSGAEDAAWRVRLNAPGEWRRAYGSTAVFVDPYDGRVLADFDARKAPASSKFLDILFPLHTGEAGGLIGRLAVVAIGIWLATMILLGLLLWLARRRKVGNR